MSLDSLRAKRDDEDKSKADLRFWRAENPFSAVFANATKLSRYAAWQRQRALYFACLYGDAETAAMMQGATGIDLQIPQTMTTNIVRRQVDRYTAAIVKNRPLPMAITNGGKYGAQRRAKAINKFAEGVLEQVGYWPTREQRIRDGAIAGSGFARNYRIGKKLFHDRMLYGEVMVDPRDAFYGKPRTIYLRHYVDRLVLTEQHPEFEEEIRTAESKVAEDDLMTTWDDEMSDVVAVIEAIHLPSGDIAESDEPDGDKSDAGGDGAYAKCISNATLSNRRYLRDYHPVSKNDFSKPLVGYFGEGMVCQLAGLQYEINSVGLRMQESGFMTPNAIWTQDGGGLEVDLLDNSPWSVIRSATEPKVFQPSPWHPQFFQYFESLINERPGLLTGMSSLSSRGEMPQGVDGGSGKAIRAFKDTDQENIVPQGREDERDVVDTMWQLFDLMEEIESDTDSHGTKYQTRVRESSRGRDSFSDQDYAKIRVDRETCTLVTFPTAYLASTPTDRWAQVSEMSEKGYFSTDEGMSLLGFPDIKRILNLRNAPRDIVEAIIEKLLDPDFKGTITPESVMNLDLCVAIGACAYLEAKWIDDAPEELCDRVLAFALAARKKRDNPDQPIGAGPQPGSQDPNALPGEVAPPGPDVNVPGMPPPGPAQLMAPPSGALLPPNAVAPGALPPPGA